MTPAADSGEALAESFPVARDEEEDRLRRVIAVAVNDLIEHAGKRTRPSSLPEGMGEADKKLLADLRARAKDVAESVTMARHEQSHFHSGTLEPEVIPVRPEETLWGKIVNLIDRIAAELAQVKDRIAIDEELLIPQLRAKLATAKRRAQDLWTERQQILSDAGIAELRLLARVETAETDKLRLRNEWNEAIEKAISIASLPAGGPLYAPELEGKHPRDSSRINYASETVKRLRALKRPSPEKQT